MQNSPIIRMPTSRQHRERMFRRRLINGLLIVAIAAYACFAVYVIFNG